MRLGRGWLLVVVVVYLGGCAARRAGRERRLGAMAALDFPTAAKLEALAARQAPPLPAGAEEEPAWLPGGPFPETIGEARVALPDAPWDASFVGAPARAAAGVDLACAARELGRFYLDKRNPPSDWLRHEIAGWCGLSAGTIDAAFYTLEGDDSALFARWGQRVADQVARAVRAGGRVNVWSGSAHGLAVVALATAPRGAILGRLSLQPDPEGRVHLSGRLVYPADRAVVRINRGRLGVATCALDEKVALPRFDATCTMAPEDATAWIELGASEPERALMTVRVAVLARRPGAEPTDVRAWYGFADSDPTLGELEQVNRVRHEAGLAPLTLATGESALADRLAPRFFADLASHAGGEADEIALGLMAGWSVDGKVASAMFYAALVRASDPRYLLAASLESPHGRATLLDPDSTVLAVGRLASEAPRALGAVFVTYGTIDDPPGHEVAQGLALVDNARRARGLTPATPIAGLEGPLTATARRLRAGQITLGQAGSEVARALRSRTLGVEGRIWLIVGCTFEDLPVPDDVVTRVAPDVTGFVVAVRDPGTPWWHWAGVTVTLWMSLSLEE